MYRLAILHITILALSILLSACRFTGVDGTKYVVTPAEDGSISANGEQTELAACIGKGSLLVLSEYGVITQTTMQIIISFCAEHSGIDGAQVEGIAL